MNSMKARKIFPAYLRTCEHCLVGLAQVALCMQVSKGRFSHKPEYTGAAAPQHAFVCRLMKEWFACTCIQKGVVLW